MKDNKPFPITWEQVQRDSRILANKLKENYTFDAVVAVSRGGLVPAAIISKELDIKLVDTVCFNKSPESESAEQKIHESILKSSKDFNGKVLVLDDVVNSGDTARLVRQNYPQAIFAVLYVKTNSVNMVDQYVTEVGQDSWIVFPWEKEV